MELGKLVVNDGFFNVYTINSSYGTVTTVSTAKLRKYIKEINAAVLMDQVEKSGEFTGAMKGAAGKVVDGAVDLVNDPVGSVSGAISGVGSLFSRAGESMKGTRSDTEDSALKAMLGYSTAKRQYAYEFGVDVYLHQNNGFEYI